MSMLPHRFSTEWWWWGRGGGGGEGVNHLPLFIFRKSAYRIKRHLKMINALGKCHFLSGWGPLEIFQVL